MKTTKSILLTNEQTGVLKDVIVGSLDGWTGFTDRSAKEYAKTITETTQRALLMTTVYGVMANRRDPMRVKAAKKAWVTIRAKKNVRK